ncbi:Uncharacterised protein [Mycobacteroides abscessus subsp. abscessus]|nr:Uncharacterised protein [Mycobacteroides abscessus subsp. abscessus]
MGDACREFADLEPAFDIALGVGEGLAVFLGEHRGQVVDLRAHQVDELGEHAGTLLRVAGGPARLGLGGVRDGRLDLRNVGQWHLPHRLALRRVVHVGKAARGAGNGLSGDEMC